MGEERSGGEQLIADLRAAERRIAELERAEVALRASEQRFGLAMQSLSDVVYEWVLGDRVDWYGDVDGLMGYPSGGFPRTLEGWGATLHPEDQERVRLALEGQRRDATPYDLEYRVRKPDGGWRWWRARGAVVRDERGEPCRWIGAITDITDRKRAEAALRESEEKYRELFEDAQVGMFRSTLDGSAVLAVNQKLCEIFGYRQEEMTGNPGTMRWADPSARDRMVAELRQKGSLHDYEIGAVTRSGAVRTCVVSMRLYPEQGHLEGSAVDITARKQAENQLQRALADLERSNRELEQFAYVASHDLQEPLRMVSSYTQLLGERYKDQLDDKAKKYIGYAVDGAIRMQRLIQDLLAYSRVGTRGKPLEPTDSHSVLGEALRNLAATIEETRAIITNDDLPTVRADPGQLALVFQNLLGNAIKFRREELPRVHVSARDDGTEWVFSVQDNGIGIEPQHADRVFAIFQRLHTREEFPGTGIGLALCKRIVERHGGRIWFESQPGQGSTFCFTIPKPEGSSFA